MPVTFRYATLEDLPAVVATYNSTIASKVVTADLEPVSVESRIPWFNDHSEQNRPLWIVEKNSQYAGWMSFKSFYGRAAYNGTVEVSIYLEDQFRGSGIGTQCLDKALLEAPRFKIHTLLGFIFGHNESSLRLFEKAGFEKWANLPMVAEMEGTMRDLIIVGKKTCYDPLA